ncbi:MAG: acetylornithine deacetylase [Gammaproteobacteria bacterium]|nr:acetylornithine deacetylase [Gammaproteobacteria bacterium]
MDAALNTIKRQLSTLVAIPTVSSVNPAIDMDNLPLVHELAAWLVDAGFATEIQTVDEANGKANLIATLGSGPGGLVLSGHTDTVPYNGELWTNDPFEMTERNERFYGLGTADMKCFFPIVLAALGRIERRSIRFPLTVYATADEESSMSGARRLLETGTHRGACGLIGEPTGLIPVYKHKGVMMIGIEVTGRSGHSSDPSLGDNAIDGAMRIALALNAWRETLARKHCDQAFKVTVPTLNFGSIHGGDNPNRICGSCELQLDLRLLPGMDMETMAAELARISKDAVAGSGLAVEVSELMPGVGAFETPRTGPAVTLAEALTGVGAGTIAFATEAPFLNQMGVETVILGPGHVAQAHQPDEYVEVAGILKMIDIVEAFIRNFCCHD